MLALLLSLLVLPFGPLLYGWARRSAASIAFLDGFLLVSLGGVILLHVLPETVAIAGGWTALLFLAGVFLPIAVERSTRGLASRAYAIAVGLAIAGLIVHSLFDGVAFSLGGEVDAHGHAHHDHAHDHDHAHGEESSSIHSHALPLAVVLHRIPESIAIWWLLRPRHGALAAIAAMALLAIGSVVGFSLAETFGGLLESASLAAVQIFAAGLLLHVISHRSPEALQPIDRGRRNTWSGIGALAALLLVAGAVPADMAAPIGREFLRLALESAPALLLGYLAAGLIHVFLSGASVRWLGRGNALQQATRGMAFGLPLPVCSCGVLPVYRSLVVRGVPPAAAMAFLVATPELGIDALLLSFPLLGAELTFARLASAVLLALLVGCLVGARVRAQAPAAVEPEACCAEHESFAQRLRRAWRVGAFDLVDRTGAWILFGLGVAAMIGPLAASGLGVGLPMPLEVGLFALLGMPTYVCATGATPLVAMLIWKGVSPGAALAFLLTGPATNVTTYGVLSRLHGRRVAFSFGATMVVGSIVLGVLVNALLAPRGGEFYGPHDHGGELWRYAPLAVLLALFAASMFRLGPRHFFGQFLAPDLHDDDDECGPRAADHDHHHDHGHGHGHGHDPAHDHRPDHDHGHGHAHEHSHAHA